jgi:hypothetical protein
MDARAKPRRYVSCGSSSFTFAVAGKSELWAASIIASFGADVSA